MQIDKEKFLAVSLSMTLGGAAAHSIGCKRKPAVVNIDIDDPTLFPSEQGALSAKEYYDQLHQTPYETCAPVWEGAADQLHYAYSRYDECYVRCFDGDQTECYTPAYECVTQDPTGECINWQEYMEVVTPRSGTCAYWEVLPAQTAPDMPSIECVDYHL